MYTLIIGFLKKKEKKQDIGGEQLCHIVVQIIRKKVI